MNFYTLRDNYLLFKSLGGMVRVRYYPVYLDISKRKCVVIGGGEVARRKVERLLESEARVCVVSREMAPALLSLKEEKKITHIDDEYRKKHITGAFLVVGATDRDEINEAICRDSRELGIPVNIVDDPVRCDFILPSLLQRGDLSIAVSTAGKSPLLARRIREDLERTYGQEYVVLLDIMGTVREKILSRGGDSEANRKVFESILDSPILRHIREKDWARIGELLFDLTGENVELMKNRKS